MTVCHLVIYTCSHWRPDHYRRLINSHGNQRLQHVGEEGEDIESAEDERGRLLQNMSDVGHQLPLPTGETRTKEGP
jgi:hypothetical protein